VVNEQDKKQERRRRATISDVAARANTGKTSISRYLNGEFQLLSEDLKRRIEQAIAELDYRPNQMARGLKRGQTRLIGLIVADITNPYSVEVIRGVESACLRLGFMVMVCNAANSTELEKRYLQLLNGYRVDGLIVNSVGITDSSLRGFIDTGTPFVLVDRKIEALNCDIVGLDNRQATVLAMEHLLAQNFEALLFLCEPAKGVDTRTERRQAFHDTLASQPGLRGESHEVELPADEELDRLIADFSARHRGMRKAIITANGVLTLQVALTLRRLGLNWGSDIGFLSFDNLAWAELAGSGITSISQPTFAMGEVAVECLVGRIRDRQQPFVERRFPGQLVVRGSTAY